MMFAFPMNFYNFFFFIDEDTKAWEMQPVQRQSQWVTELEFRTLGKPSPEPELQPPTHRGPAWPLALHCPGPPRPRSGTSLHRGREAQRGRGCRVVSVAGLAEKNQFSGDASSSLCDPGGDLETVQCPSLFLS